MAQREDHVDRPEEDLYLADKKRNICLYYYYRFVNPWIRFLIIIPILYFYSVSSSVLTYRNDIFQENLDTILINHKGYVPGSRPLLGDDKLGWFILYDLGFDAIPAASEGSYPKWKLFCDFNPISLNIILFVLLLIRRDCIRLWEYGWYQIVLFTLNGLVHVLTTLPDAGGIQSSCHDPKFYHTGKHSWFWYTFTFTYCGDMMWSGHTVNTLLPMIMIRRLCWDLFGWHFTYHYANDDSKLHRNKAAIRADAMRQQQLRDLQLLLQYSTFDVRYDSSQAFAQFVAMAHERAQENYDERTSKESMKGRDWRGRPKEPAVGPGAGPGVQKPDPAAATVSPDASDSVPVPIEIEAEETSRLNNVSYDQEVKNIQQRNLLTTAYYFEVAKTNHDHDLFLRRMTSPYVTPVWAARHRKFWWILLFIVRCLAPLYFGVFVFSVIVIRYHYSADVVVAILAVLAISFNPPLAQNAVRYLYRPYYHNYLIKHCWAPVYPTYPLNEEQVNFEERIRMIGYGGLF